MTERIEVFLTSAQKNKFQSGKTFQLTAHQLSAGTGKFHVEIEMTKKNHRELLRNVSKNKGYRFTSAKIVGAGFFGDIAKSVAKAAAPAALDFIGEKTGQKGITDALKGSADGLIDVAANKISGGKLTKGSQAMKDHMARLRGMRKGKVTGGNIGDDIKNAFKKTFNPDLGNKIKDVFTSPIAKTVYKGLANAGLSLASDFTGAPLSLASGAVDSAIDGAGIRRRRNLLVKGGTLVSGVPVVQIRGKGFNGANGTRFAQGGSFKSAGGSMVSP
jgi:hypothetical protein